MASNALIAGISFVGLAIVSTCGYFLYEGMKTTSLITLKELPLYTTGESKNKFGGLYSSYFMSTEPLDNLPIWEDRAQYIKDKNVVFKTDTGFFKDIQNKIEAEEIKKICKSKYDSEQEENKEEEWLEIWNFCSVGGTKLVTLSTTEHQDEKTNVSSTWSSKVGGDSELKTKLLSVKSSSNNWFWNIRERLFAEGKLAIDATKDMFFAANKKAYPNEKLRNFCFKAYAKEKNTVTTNLTAERPTQNEVLKFCSVSKISVST